MSAPHIPAGNRFATAPARLTPGGLRLIEQAWILYRNLCIMQHIAAHSHMRRPGDARRARHAVRLHEASLRALTRVLRRMAREGLL